MADAIDAAASVAGLIGSTAQAALTIGNTALSILQGTQTVLAILGVAFPPAAILANDLQVALPIIADIAKYAPVVQSGLAQGKSLFGIVTEIGEDLWDKLGNLEKIFPGIVIGEVALAKFFAANNFTPQDPRFARGNAGDA